MTDRTGIEMWQLTDSPFSERLASHATRLAANLQKATGDFSWRYSRLFWYFGGRRE